MRTKKKYLAVLFIICMLAGCISAPESTVQKEITNLVLNVGFEEGINDESSYWFIATHTSPRLNLYWDRAVSYNGQASITIANHNKSIQRSIFWEQGITKFPKNKKLMLSGFIKTENVSKYGVAICIRVENGEGHVLQFAATPLNLFEGTHEWTEVNTSVIAPQDAKEIRILAFLVGTGQVWFDDIQLIVGEEAEPLSTTPVPTTTPTILTPIDTEYTPQTPLEQKEWTLMFYDDADFYRAFNPINWFEEEAYSGENLNVVVLEDIEKGPASTWYVQENGKSIKVKDNGEVNMGASQTLQEFIAFCKEWYPANGYYLFLYDHGMGWEGACIDITSENDSLSMDEIQKALTDVGGVDIIAFSGCVMGAVESAYELRDCVEIYIGSEEMNGYGSWGRVVGDICEILNGEPKISDPDLAKRILKSFAKYAEESQEEGITMSAIRTDRIDALTEAIDALGSELIQKLPTSYDEIVSLWSATQMFGFGQMIDIYDLADKCIQFFPDLSENALTIKQLLNETVINEYHDDVHPNAHGLAIYFPDANPIYPQGEWDPSYATSDLDFTEDTHWDEFLSLYYDSE